MRRLASSRTFALAPQLLRLGLALALEGQARQTTEDTQVVPQIPGCEEVVAHEFDPCRSHAFRFFLVVQQEEDLVEAFLRGVDEEARLSVDDLARDAADVSGDHRSSFPYGLRDYPSETFPDRL